MNSFPHIRAAMEFADQSGMPDTVSKMQKELVFQQYPYASAC